VNADRRQIGTQLLLHPCAVLGGESAATTTRNGRAAACRPIGLALDLATVARNLDTQVTELVSLRLRLGGVAPTWRGFRTLVTIEPAHWHLVYCGYRVFCDKVADNRTRRWSQVSAQAESRLAQAVQALVGKACWGIVAGSGTGSVVDFLIGTMIPLGTPLTNPQLSPEVRYNDSQLGVFVKCAWRLDGPSAVAAGCWDSNEEGGPMLSGLAQVKGQLITGAAVISAGLDLELRFSSGHLLRVFCDQTNAVNENDNYSVLTPDIVVSVGCRSVVRSRPRGW